VKPIESTAPVREGRLELEVRPYTVMRVRFPRA
jgi:hypothetical protein